MGLLSSLIKEIARRGPSKDAGSLQTTLAQLSVLLQQRGTPQRQEALETLRQMLKQHPDAPDAHALMGDALLADKANESAQASYRRALALKPEHARAQEGLGLVLLGQGQPEQASLHLATAHRLAPMNAEVLVHWGLAELALGNLREAGSKFQKAIERDTRNPNAWQNLGLVSYQLGQFADSIQQLRQAIMLNPQHGLAYSNLALALRQQNDLDGALEAAQQAVSLKADSARVWVVLGDLYSDCGDFTKARESLGKALALDARSVSAQIGLGKLHQATGAHDEARRNFEAALTLDPGNADARGGLGQLLLLLGQWRAGWEAYEARRLTQPPAVRRVPAREWEGHPLKGQRVLVHAEQGLGDIILFSSCVPDLLAQGGHCLLDVPTRLAGLMQRSFPEAQVLAHEMTMPEEHWLASLPPFDVHVPIGTLPRWLRQSSEQFPKRHAFLKADPARMTIWAERLAARRRPRIGVSWRGGLLSTAGHQRCIDLSLLAQALHGLDIDLVSLQYGDTHAELEAVNHAGQRVHAGLSGYGDLDDLAALTASLDAVITVCSTQAHLSGGLGVPTAVLVPVNPSWRYGAHGDAMPWYGSLTLLRQRQLGDWSPCLAALRPWLSQLPAFAD
jgi:tetratricopeptide (TPR) repeat protein